MIGNYPPNISPAEWNAMDRDDEEEEFDPSCDDGGYCRGDER